MRKWRFWIGVVVSLVCLVLVLWNVEYREVLSALQQANYAWLIPAALPFIGTIACKVLRWQPSSQAITQGSGDGTSSPL